MPRLHSISYRVLFIHRGVCEISIGHFELRWIQCGFLLLIVALYAVVSSCVATADTSDVKEELPNTATAWQRTLSDERSVAEDPAAIRSELDAFQQLPLSVQQQNATAFAVTPSEEPATAAFAVGRRFQDCPECPEMVVVPAGSFMMGSPPSQETLLDLSKSLVVLALHQVLLKFERPQHPVTISQPFAVGVFEVTFREWDACIADGGCGKHRPGDKGWGRENLPVIFVNWEDAQAYVTWLSSKTGAAYRLLSEAEWEYVARAGTTTSFHTGATILTSQANYNGVDQPSDPYGGGKPGTKHGRPTPVGTFDANAFGLHDVHGNVFEWVQDCWNDNYVGAPSDGGAWEHGDCSERVVRSGYFGDIAMRVRSTSRDSKDLKTAREPFTGFRVARSLTPLAATETAGELPLDKQLTKAALQGDAGKIRSLLKSGADINAKPEGVSALFFAASRGHLEVVSLLVEAGANVNSQVVPKDHEELMRKMREFGWAGTTPVIVASWLGHTDVVKFLVEADADVNLTSFNGTALMLACVGGYVDIAEALVGAGANVKSTWNGITALTYAVQSGHVEVARLLIEEGAYEPTTVRGIAIRAIAENEGHTRIVELLDAANVDN